MKFIKNGSLRALGAFATLVAMVFIASIFVSCDKNEVLGETSLIAHPMDVVDSSDFIEIPTRTTTAVETYYVKQIYKTAYKHIKQDPGACSWTNYTLAAAAIARGNGKNFPYQLSNPTVADYRRKIKDVQNECKASQLITKLESYSHTWDQPAYSINARVVSKETFNQAVSLFLEERRGGNQAPCIFIGGIGSVGHYLTLWDLEWDTSAENSYVYVTDTMEGSINNFGTFNQMRVRKQLSTVLRTKDLTPNMYYNFMFFDW